MAALDLSRQAMSFMRDLPPKQFRQIMLKILELAANPFPNDAIALKGIEGCYRVSVGEYRIAYRLESENVQVVVVENRNDDAIYKTLKRKL